MPRIAVSLALAALVAVMAVPALAAVEATDEQYQGIAELVEGFLAENAPEALDSGAVVPAVDSQVYSPYTLEPPGVDGEPIRITDGFAVRVPYPPDGPVEGIFEAGGWSCGPPGPDGTFLACPPPEHPFEPGMDILFTGARFAAPLPPGACGEFTIELGVLLRQPGDVWQSDFGGDFFNGGNLPVVTRCTDGSWAPPEALRYDPASATNPFPVAPVSGYTLVGQHGFVTVTQPGEADAFRLFTYRHPVDPGPRPDTVAASTWPDVTVTTELVELDLVPGLADVVPAPEPTATTTPTAPGGDASATAAASPVAEVTVGDEGGGSLGAVTTVLLVIGGALIAIALVSYFRTRERARSRPSHAPGGDAGDPRDAPAVAGDDHGADCDWAAYFHHPDRGAVVLRKATGRECCSYHVTVRTRVTTCEAVARGRQDTLEPGAPDRLRIPDLAVAPAGLALGACAGARSGPAGTLEWMQGLGEHPGVERAQPIALDPRDEQAAPPDVAAVLRYREETDVDVWLEAGCEHANTYEWEGSGSLDVGASRECTNEGAASCPVRHTGTATARSGVSGALGYSFGHDTGSMAGRAFADHDHPVNDRAAYEATERDADDAKQQADRTAVRVTHEVELDAGVSVPQDVWPSTGRVSAHLETYSGHGISLRARMRRDPGGCCDHGGHGACACEPALGIDFGPFGDVVRVDGKVFSLSRPVSIPVGDEGRSWDVS